jgi:Mg-chelatase subunit ChlD
MSTTPINSGGSEYQIPTGGLAKISPHVVYLLVDCSTSMEGPSLQQAKNGAIKFATDARTRGYRVGLIRFADKANALMNPDTGFTQAIQNLIAYGNTNLTAAIELATEHLVREATGERIICVVTDGMPDNQRTALKAAKRATQNDIEIMVIGTSEADRKFLSKLATRAGLYNYVEKESLEKGVTDMARLLPPPRSN